MGHSPFTEEELLERLKADDAEAFNILFHKNWNNCYRLALAKTGDEQVSSDIVQDIFVHIWLRRDSLEIQESLAQYLSGAVRNQVFNYYRTNRRETEALKQLGRTMDGDLTADHTAGDKQETALKEMALENAVNNLPDRMKDVYLLRIRHEYSFRDIAETLNIKPQTAKNAFSRAVALLRENLTEHLVILIITIIMSGHHNR
jgi:RNA polymerase sigma factor (sigma-70 family)